MEKNCFDDALIAAVESGNHSNVGKLILRGASNINKALEESRKLKQYAVTATLLIVKAAIENDRILILKLYGEDVQKADTKIPLTEEDDIAELQHVVRSQTIKTVMPIEIARRHSASAAREELLLRTDADKETGAVLWFGLRLTHLEISWLQKIHWVKELKLARNEFTSLPSEIGSYLKRCTKLELQRNELSRIPPCLLELPSIIELNLSYNNIVEIPVVPEWSATLSVLDLSYNRLKTLPDSAEAPNLKELNISNNQLRAVPPCVCSFVSLITLNIANNSEILTLPSELARLKKILNLHLDGLIDLNDPPRSVRTSTDACMTYLKSRLLSARGYYRMKLMLVGKQNMGKSTIVARLQGRDIGDESTVGVDVSEWKCTYKKTFYFSIWDFAGQEEYYATHQCFLSRRSLYLLVWDITEGDAGVSDLKPWLSNISVRAPNSCVIIVGTFLDKVSEEDRQSGKLEDLKQKIVKLAAQYQRLTVTKVTMVGLKGRMENVAGLREDIYNAASEYKIRGQYVMGHEIPSSYHILDDKLASIRQKVKNGEHEPIMHTAEFKKMVKYLNLVDLQDDEEIRTVTQFLHEVGALLHYDDRKNNLDDLYFVDPRWLCDLMSTIVTVKERNPYVKKGILHSKYIPLLFKNQHFPSKYFQQYLTLLSRFEIALPLDKERKRILIPSMLPETRPAIVNKKLLNIRNCTKRFIIFCSVSRGNSYPCPTPSGLWSRLLARIVNSVTVVKDLLRDYVTVEESNHIVSTNVRLNSETGTLYSVSEEISKEQEPDENCDTLSNFTSSANLKKESSQNIEPTALSLATTDTQQPEQQDVFSDERSLFYWRTGLLCSVNELCFIIQSLSDGAQDEGGVSITCSSCPEGHKVFGQLIDLVEQLISDWYELSLDHLVPCYECVKSGASAPYKFKVDELLPLAASNKAFTECGDCHSTLQLTNLVPDLMLADLDPAFLLNSNDVIYQKDKDNFLGKGGFGEVYSGKYEGRSVAVKLYTAKEASNVQEWFKQLRSESKVLQQLHHPCLVCMVGVTVHPTMSLVLEEAPLGGLQNPLLKEPKAISRIVMHRIAVQVASALHFLHSINIIFRDLKADNVLLWSLSPDHLINCKVTDFNIAAHGDPAGSRGMHGTKGFVAPEVAYVNLSKERSVYDHRADIFSFGMFLYQMIARRHPYHNMERNEIEVAIEQGQRPELEDIPVAEIGLLYMTRIMKLCWKDNVDERPRTESIVKWFSAPSLQLIMGVLPLSSDYSVRGGCIVTPILRNEVEPVPVSSELWICCDGVKGIELNIFYTHTMGIVCTPLMVKDNQVRCMKQCGDHIWLASRPGLEYGGIDIFNKNTKESVHHIKMRENAVSCITNSDKLVYVGTMEGYCFAFPIDVQMIQNDNPKLKYVSEHCVDGITITKTCLWVSTRGQIHFLHPDSLDLEGMVMRKKNIQAFVGMMQFSDNEDQVWSAHIGGVIMSSWNAHQRVHLCDVDVGVIAKEKLQVGNMGDSIVTAMCTGLDTVWIGLASGHIIVFGMNPPGEVLTYFRPYHSYVRFLSSTNFPGPCGKEECMMLSGGKMYQPDYSYKELASFSGGDENTGVVVLWEVLPAKYMRQVHYLCEGTSYLNYFNLKETMINTGFTESVNNLPTATNIDTTQTDTFYAITNDKAECNHETLQEPLVNHLNDDNTLSNVLSGLLSDT